MRSLKHGVALGAVAAAACLLPSQAAPLRYKVEGIGGPSANGIFTAAALNNMGQVAGMNFLGSGVLVPFIFQDGRLSQPDELRKLNIFTIGAINDHGDVGGSFFRDSNFYPFVYHDGKLTDLSAGLGPGHGQVYSINQAGHAVGYSFAQQGGYRSIYYDGKRVEVFENLDLSFVDINDHDTIVHSQGFYIEQGEFKFLPALDGRHGINALRAINNAGQIVGGSLEIGATGVAPFLYSHGVMTNLGSIGGHSGAALDINDKGWIVGEADSPQGDLDAFLYRDGVMRNVEDLLVPRDLGHWDFSGAVKINERGQILVSLNAAAPTDFRSALLTPVPEAQSWALMLAGLGVLGAVAGRWRVSPPRTDS